MDTQREAISYGRFSSGKQEQGNSLSRQEQGYREVISRYAESKGLFESKRFGFGKLFDKGKSGFHGQHLDGGELGHFLAMVRSGEIKSPAVLVIDEWSRFGRIEPDLAVKHLSEIVRKGIAVAVAYPDMFVEIADLSSPQFVIISMLLQLAHQESLTKSRHQKKVRASIRDTGMTKKGRLLAACPSWISVSEDGTTYRLNDKAPMLKEAVKLAIKGYGCLSIKRELGLDEMEWGGLATIFRQRTLLGEYQPKIRKGKNDRDAAGAVKKDYYPALLTEAEFYKLQAALDSRVHSKGKKGEYVTNLFTDLIFDTTDGERMVIYRSSYDNTPTLKSRKIRKGRKQVRYELVESTLLRFLREVSLTEEQPDGLLCELEGQLAEVSYKAEQVTMQLMERGSKAGFLGAALDKLDKEKTRLQDAIEIEKRKTANTNDERLQACKTILEKLKSANNLLDMRTRLRSEIRGLVKEIRCTVLSAKRANLEIEFHNGLKRGVWFADDAYGLFSTDGHFPADDIAAFTKMLQPKGVIVLEKVG